MYKGKLLTESLQENELSNMEGLDLSQSEICVVKSSTSWRSKQIGKTVIFWSSRYAATVDHLDYSEGFIQMGG